jgi:hypothetical protein
MVLFIILVICCWSYVLPLWELGKGPSPKARVSVFRGCHQITTTKRSEPGNKAKEKETFSS